MDKKYKKVLFITIILYILMLILGIYLTSIDWIAITDLLIYFILIPLVVPAFIFGAVYIYKNWMKGKKEDDNVFKRSEKVDSTSVIPWIKKYMLEHYHDVIEIKHNQYKAQGRKDRITPIIYIQADGITSNLKYHILINLIEPDKKHTVISGYYNEGEIERMAEALSFDSPTKAVERIKIIMPDGTIKEISKDIYESEKIIVEDTKKGGKKDVD